jgi:hypothetical protein
MNEPCDAFLHALGAGLREGERLILCSFEGDPNSAGRGAWKPRSWRAGRPILLPESHNGYVTVGAFGKAHDGTFRRRVDCFKAGLALMVDDVGTKVPREVVAAVAPSAVIRTSPGNEQFWYFLREPERDWRLFDAVIRAFIAGRLLGADPGMAGVNRVGRLPGFTNGKAAYNGYRTELLALDGARRYSVAELVSGFGLSLNNGRQATATDKMRRSGADEENARGFAEAWRQLKELGMLKGGEPDPSGWIEIRCPWLDDHTNRADTGAAIRLPAAENEYYGAFRCHHGHCATRGWRHLTDLLDGVNEESMNERFIPEGPQA